MIEKAPLQIQKHIQHHGRIYLSSVANHPIQGRVIIKANLYLFGYIFSCYGVPGKRYNSKREILPLLLSRMFMG